MAGHRWSERGPRISAWTEASRPLDLCVSVFDAFPPGIQVRIEPGPRENTEIVVRPDMRVSPSETTAFVLSVATFGLVGLARDVMTWSLNRRRFFDGQVELCNTVWRSVADAITPGNGGYRAAG